MTLEEWKAKGKALFGENTMKWKFICPVCKHIASVQNYKDAGAPIGAVGFSCIGRWLSDARDMFGEGKGPCNYAGGGLLSFNSVEIDGEYFFEFAPVEIPSELN